jgi:hypothetical protein
VGAKPTGLTAAYGIDSATLPSYVVANTGSNTVDVIRKLGPVGEGPDKGFAITELASGAGPSATAAVDIDLDGLTDVIVANGDDDTVSIFRVAERTGLFTVAVFDPAVIIPVGHHPSAIAVLDHHPLAPDLVVANRDDATITILINAGHGAFSAGPTLTVGAGPVALEVGNLGSGRNGDIVVANHDDNSIGVLLQNVWGTYDAMKSYSTGTSPVAIALDPATASVEINDVNDLWVANADSNDVSHFAYQSAGDYASAVNTPVGGSPRAIGHGSNMTYVLDYDHGVFLTLETGYATPVGHHPTSAATMNWLTAVTNEDAGTVTFVTLSDCILPPR